MKILLFRTDPSIMNIEHYNSQEIGMAKAYTAAGHVCDIVYYNGDNPSRVERIDAGDGKYINLYWVKGFRILNNGFFPGISRLLNEYDVIQVSEYYFFASWYVYTFFAKTKKVYIYQGVYDSDNSSKYKLRCMVMDPILLRKRQLVNTQVFTKSNIALESMKKRGFQKVKTVGVGLDFSRLQKECALSPWVSNLVDRKGQTKYLLYVGVLEERRNILFLLDILNRTIPQIPDTKLILVGKGKPEYTEQVFQRVRELGLSDHVIYKDALQQNELAHLYKTADVFLLPSKYEIFGMVLMEAMTFGLPVISSYNGGSSTIIDSGENGIIMREFDAEVWGSTVVNLLKDRDRWTRISTAAQSTGADRFSWQTIVSQILSTLMGK